MELTIEQALQQGITAHKEGKLQEAERLYRVILQSQPTHPDANHNLGVLAVAVNKAEEALLLFKTALEANPKIEQFWLSYIDALIKEQQFDNANQVLEQAKKWGLTEEKLNILEAQLNKTAQVVENRTGRGKEACKDISPSQAELKNLLDHFQNGRYDSAENLASSMAKEFPGHQFGWKVLGAIFGQSGRVGKALIAHRKAIKLGPQDAKEYSNLGVTLKGLGRLEEAESSYKRAIVARANFAEAHSNLAGVLSDLGRFSEAEASFRQAIELKPDYAEAHNNLGATIRELGRFSEAEASYRQAIELKPNYAEAHNNLGNSLQELGRFKEAEASYRQAIELKPYYAEAHSNLGSILYINGDVDAAIERFEKTNDIDPELKSNELLLRVVRAKKARRETGLNPGNATRPSDRSGLSSNPLILNRAVEAELIAALYEMNSRELDKTPDTRFGNGRCSPDYNMFNDDRLIIKTVANDLINMMELAVKSEVYVYDSFFNIYGAGAGITPHAHLNKVDKEKYFNLEKQKYSLVYYLDIGDQDCSEPGILTLYDPEEEILPCEGMIVTFPAGRHHSAVYGGKKDRVMIGANFYSL